MILWIFAILLPLLQRVHFLEFFGLNPNLTMVFLIVASALIVQFKDFLLLVLVSGLILQFHPSLSWDIFIWFVIIFLVFFLQRFLPWNKIISLLFLIFISTLIFYLLIDSGFFVSYWVLVVLEALYNVFLGSIIYWFLKNYYSEF